MLMLRLDWMHSRDMEWNTSLLFLRGFTESFGEVKGDTSGCGEPPVDFKTKVLFWPGLSWPGQAKMELLF